MLQVVMKQARTVQFLTRLREIHPAVAGCMVVVSLGVVSVLDLITGPDFSFSVFYYVVVGISTLMLGLVPGSSVAFLTSIIWTVVAILSGRHYSSTTAIMWTIVIRAANFWLLVLLLDQLQKIIAELQMQSLRDPLTQSANRRYFEDYLARLLKMAARGDPAFTVAYFDIDNFKAINDRLGHAVGDEVLQIIATTIQDHIRPQDMLARLGGDEFALVLQGTSYESAREILSRIFNMVQAGFADSRMPVSLSIGAVSFTQAPQTTAAVIHVADTLMYDVKKHGKAALRHIQV